MFDLHDLTSLGLLVLGGITKYLHGELKDRPTREEVMLRLNNIELKFENIEDKLDNIKDDIVEIKQNQERIDG